MMVALISSTNPFVFSSRLLLHAAVYHGTMCQNRRKALIVVLDRHLGMSLAPAVEEILHTRQVLARLSIGLGRLTDDDALHLLLLDISFAEFEKSSGVATVANPLAMICNGSVTASPVRFLP